MSKALYIVLMLLFGVQLAMADPVSDFSLPDLQGKQQSLAQYRGKWVIINYWATTCPPCVKEIPELEDFYNRHKDKDAVVLGVNYEDIKSSWLKDFISSVHLTYPVLRAREGVPTPFGSIVMLPTTIIVSPAGHLMGVQRGGVTAKALEGYLKQQEDKAASGS